MKVFWYTKEDFEKENKKESLVAMGLFQWGNCFAGNVPLTDFGEGLVILGQKIGISPTSENLMKLSKEILKG